MPRTNKASVQTNSKFNQFVRGSQCSIDRPDCNCTRSHPRLVSVSAGFVRLPRVGPAPSPPPPSGESRPPFALKLKGQVLVGLTPRPVPAWGRTPADRQRDGLVVTPGRMATCIDATRPRPLYSRRVLPAAATEPAPEFRPATGPLQRRGTARFQWAETLARPPSGRPALPTPGLAVGRTRGRLTTPSHRRPSIGASRSLARLAGPIGPDRRSNPGPLRGCVRRMSGQPRRSGGCRRPPPP